MLFIRSTGSSRNQRSVSKAFVMDVFVMAISNRDSTRQARKALNRFNRAVKKCQRELESLKQSLFLLEGEAGPESDLEEFAQNLDAMLEFLNEKMRLLQARWLSASIIDSDNMNEGEEDLDESH